MLTRRASGLASIAAIAEGKRTTPLSSERLTPGPWRWSQSRLSPCASSNFRGITPAATGRPSYHPSVLLKIYVYGYINQIASSRRLEREARRNVELMWLTGRLAPDFKTIADFRKDNGPAIRAT
jgi:hypothetical protein